MPGGHLPLLAVFMDYRIEAEQDGMRLSDYLRNTLRLSHGEISRLKRLEDGILLCGVRVTVRATLHTGDLLSLALEDRESAESVIPADLPLDILYEDESLIALNKPPFMPTHPSNGHQADTLANALAYYFEKRGTPFVFRTLNRLDRDTSGTVLVSKDRRTAARLSEQLRAGEIRKRYLAVLHGRIDPPAGILDAPIRRVAGSKMEREIAPGDPLAKQARTAYETLAVGTDGCLVSARPLTGRTHQLRVHFSSVGHPIVGDSLYGNPHPAIGRQALHAAELTLIHPYTGAPLTVTAPLPDDIQKLLKEMRLCP